MSSRHRTVDSHSNFPSENENDDPNNQTDNNIEFCLDQSSVEPNTNLTEKTQQNRLHISEPSSSKIFVEQRHNPSVELQKHFSEDFLLEQLKLKKNVYEYIINKESKLQINYYENKNWNVINCYNN